MRRAPTKRRVAGAAEERSGRIGALGSCGDCGLGIACDSVLQRVAWRHARPQVRMLYVWSKCSERHGACVSEVTRITGAGCKFHSHFIAVRMRA